MPEIFQNEIQTWDAEYCKKQSKHVEKDGLGTPYGFKGACPYVKNGIVRYNGGCIRNNEWYRGEEFFLPILAPGYKWQYVTTWCWQIVKV